jgi:glutathione S-transferase
LAIDQRRVAASIDQIYREFDAVSERLRDKRPFLLGDRFSAADVAFACLASPAVLPPEYSAWLPPLEAFSPTVRARALALRDTLAGAFVMRLFREERERVVR